MSRTARLPSARTQQACASKSGNDGFPTTFGTASRSGAELIADEVYISLPRAKRGLRTPPGVQSHFTDRLIDARHRRNVLGIPVTSVERTLTDLLRSGGLTEQTDLAIRQAIRRGLTTRERLEAEVPAKWRSRLHAVLDQDTT